MGTSCSSVPLASSTSLSWADRSLCSNSSTPSKVLRPTLAPSSGTGECAAQPNGGRRTADGGYTTRHELEATLLEDLVADLVDEIQATTPGSSPTTATPRPVRSTPSPRAARSSHRGYGICMPPRKRRNGWRNNSGTKSRKDNWGRVTIWDPI